jgi:murein L,D-transpeptidase YcbB/YkuD
MLVEGIKRFQRRHGLRSHGILDGQTQAAVSISMLSRVRQIELALERLRWLPDLDGRRLLLLNIPMFHIWGWDSVDSPGQPTIAMRAIVGRAVATKTPVFAGQMRYVIFRPDWNVPQSIARNELVPVIERDPGYLARENMEIVRDSDDATPLEPTAETLALLRAGALRLRQRPGPRNALGLVKFVFPNDESVYLHGTPRQELFGPSRRDFSHGCVRVEDPIALAAWALREQPEWTAARIAAATSGTSSTRVDLVQPIQVILFYTTATVVPGEGTIHFADDIYGHDATLDRALTKRRASSDLAPSSSSLGVRAVQRLARFPAANGALGEGSREASAEFRTLVWHRMQLDTRVVYSTVTASMSWRLAASRNP